jgi:hypothetical protein
MKSWTRWTVLALVALALGREVAAERVRVGPNRSGTVGVVPELVAVGG